MLFFFNLPHLELFCKEKRKIFLSPYVEHFLTYNYVSWIRKKIRILRLMHKKIGVVFLLHSTKLQ